MRLFNKLFLGALITSSTSALASPIDNYRGDNANYSNCPDDSRRTPASASQVGYMPDCAAYVSTSTITTTVQSTRLVSGVVTKTSCVEVNVQTTIVKTATTYLKPTTVTTTIPFTVASTTTTTTTTTLPVVTVTSTILFKRDHTRPSPPPPPPPSKCSYIVLFATVTATQVKDQTSYSTKTTTVTKAETNTKFTTTTTTITPVSSVTVSTTITTITTLTSTQTVAQTSTIVTSIPSACADLTAPPVNLAANTLSHPEGTYTAIFGGNGSPAPDLLSCCVTCYSNVGCFSFNFGNFNPEEIPGQFGQSLCQVFVGIDSNNGSALNTCTAPERINFITFSNPTGAGPGDFFYAGTGPCSIGIDVSLN